MFHLSNCVPDLILHCPLLVQNDPPPSRMFNRIVLSSDLSLSLATYLTGPQNGTRRSSIEAVTNMDGYFFYKERNMIGERMGVNVLMEDYDMVI